MGGAGRKANRRLGSAAHRVVAGPVPGMLGFLSFVFYLLQMLGLFVPASLEVYFLCSTLPGIGMINGWPAGRVEASCWNRRRAHGSTRESRDAGMGWDGRPQWCGC
ncbi:hypothetical protein LX36DRAFT_136283 [Colletotrichum falcatum]|nr:hypothetical protein LX36DRAFT_136283 [Colletotrichum falcatum]